VIEDSRLRKDGPPPVGASRTYARVFSQPLILKVYGSLISSRAASRVTHPFTLIFTSTQVADVCIRARFGDSFDSRARPGCGETGARATSSRTSSDRACRCRGGFIALFARAKTRVAAPVFFVHRRRRTHIIMHKRCAVLTHGSTRHASRIRMRTVGSLSGRAMAAHRAHDRALYGIATTLSEGAFLHVWLSAWLPRGTLTRDLHRFAHQVGRDGVLSHLWGRGPGAVVSTCMLIAGMAFFLTTTVGAHVLDFS